MKKEIQSMVRICFLLSCVISMLFLANCSNSTPAVKPTASFSVSTNIGSFPLTVAFNATASSDSDGSIVKYAWQFGDGNTGTGSVINNTYWTIGTYTALLTVTDNQGNTNTASTQIEVKPRYSLSGTVFSAEYIETDSDVNDFNTVPVSNDSFNEAQEVSMPVSISGYVNLAGYGPDNNGLSYNEGDLEDYYTVSLTQGTNITLFMAEDPSVSELNLYLYDDQENLQDATNTDENGAASLVVPADGPYFIRIEAADYASLATATVYVLSIGQSDTTAAQHTPRLSDNFVTDEALVLFEDLSSTVTSVNENTYNVLSSKGLYTDTRPPIREKLWKMSGTTDKQTVMEHLGVRPALSSGLAPGRVDSETASKLETLWMVRALNKTEGVRLAEPNYIRKHHLVEPNDTYYPYQWNYPLIGLPEAWGITTGSSNVVVAVVDSGILKEHPDLAGQLVDGYDFVSDSTRSLDGNGVDDDPEDPGDGGIDGSSFHGTHTSGTIAARTDNNSGVAGIAWNTKIMPLRALGSGGEGTTSDILECIRYASGMETNAGVQLNQAVDIINLSLGGSGYSAIEQAVYQEARDRGIILIASAGNDGNSQISYPAGYDGIVSVSAVDIEGNSTNYSNFGATIDLAAPGGSSSDLNGDGYQDGVLSTVGDDRSGTVKMTYAFYTGTSMAAPHVSGVVALMKAVYPAMTPMNFDSLLAAGYLTQNDGTAAWDDRLGYGIIDAYKAVLVAEEAAGGGGIPPILSVTPRTLNFGTVYSSFDLTVQNGGDGNLSVDAYYSDASWVSITPSDVDGNGFGTYIVQTTRDGLESGTYTSYLTFEASTQTVRIPVIMQIGGTGIVSGGGYHYILLVDPDTLVTAKEFSSAGNNGQYDFNFTGLSYGDTYLIYAGTDPNNDYSICTPGETCGTYLSRDKPIELTILDDLQNINFITDIIFNIPDTTAGLPSQTGRSLQRDAERKLLQ